MIFARKMPEIYIIIARKIFARILGGHVPLTPVSYAYGGLLDLSAAFDLVDPDIPIHRQPVGN